MPTGGVHRPSHAIFEIRTSHSLDKMASLRSGDSTVTNALRFHSTEVTAPVFSHPIQQLGFHGEGSHESLHHTITRNRLYETVLAGILVPL